MESKDEMPVKLLCMACLCFGRNLRELKNEKFKEYYLDALREVPLYGTLPGSPVVCWECEALLKKAFSFKEQCKDSYRILQTYTNEHLSDRFFSEVMCQPKLKIHKHESISIEPKLEDVNLEERQHNKNELEDYNEQLLLYGLINQSINLLDINTKNRISDLDNLNTLSDVQNEGTSTLMGIEVALKTLIERKGDKKRKKKLSRVNEKKKMKSNKMKPKLTTKILTVDMTYEEMIRDREREGKRERYVKSEYKCESCLLGFSHEGAYKEHNKRRHDKALGNHSCPVCRTVIPSVESFTAHYKRHTRRYECAICHKRTLDLKVMQQHYYTTHEIALKEYKCNICGKMSKSIEAHRYHRDSHKARIQCPECEKTYRHRAGLMNHRVAVHEFRNAFPCNKCDKVFRWKTSLKRHFEKHDVKSSSNQASAFCSLCNVSFASISSYQRHLKNSLKHVTQDQLKYICDHCNRRFADKTKLRDHIEEKHLYKKFQCHICFKPSKNRVGLDQHIRNVHKGRPYNAVCHYCGKRFPTRVQLESHVRTHTGERPFICEYCPTTFSQQSNLYKHNRQVHLNIKSKRLLLCKKRKEDCPQNTLENPTVGQTFPTPAAVWRYSPQRGIIM
ncbi:hypothetical protein K1T71_000698 [Dendrolimus kikuchii]|uniref:Uncharacterized protein n=1 Tax=Dendrolimus kikuchii TaxID=765133 RepID=A0ACC1DK42_9NEOP|nr:hypothetical protein K1T71_000698 [Dendrolimus kikuchii]